MIVLFIITIQKPHTAGRKLAVVVPQNKNVILGPLFFIDIRRVVVHTRTNTSNIQIQILVTHKRQLKCTLKL